MTQAKHTPGPWIWDDFSNQSPRLMTPDRGKLLIMDFVRKGMRGATARFARRTDNMGGIMEVATMENIHTFPDAHLIAAAPDLLNIGEEIKAAWAAGHTGIALSAKLNAILNKAKGE